MIRTIKVPKPRENTKQFIEYVGEFMNYVGERGDYGDVDITFSNKLSMDHKNALEYWMNLIQRQYSGVRAGATGVRLSPQEYKTDTFKIFIMNKDLVDIREFVGYGVFPKTVNSFELGYSTDNGNIHDTTVAFSIDYYEIFSIGPNGRTLIP